MEVEGDQIKITFNNQIVGLQFMGLGILLGGGILYLASEIGGIIVCGLMVVLGILLVLKTNEIIQFKHEGIEIRVPEGIVKKTYEPKELQNVRVTTTSGSGGVTGFVIIMEFIQENLKIKGGALGGPSNMDNAVYIIFTYIKDHYNFIVQLGQGQKASIRYLM